MPRIGVLEERRPKAAYASPLKGRVKSLRRFARHFPCGLDSRSTIFEFCDFSKRIERRLISKLAAALISANAVTAVSHGLMPSLTMR